MKIIDVPPAILHLRRRQTGTALPRVGQPQSLDYLAASGETSDASDAAGGELWPWVSDITHTGCSAPSTMSQPLRWSCWAQ